nr:hypothetical protein [Tanacetum cinerariifolium]
SAQTKKHDDKTKKEDKGKSHVESFTGYKDLNAKFEDCSENSRSEVNAAGFIVPTVGQNSLNNTNAFSAAGTKQDLSHKDTYGTIEEEVYVYQPPGFEDPNHPDKVYKVVKALYGLHQAPRAWYETLASYLLENGFNKGIIDQTLFIKKQKGDILLVKQKKDGIFISQDKYVAEILSKFRLTERKSASTPIDTEKPLLKDPDGEDVDVHIYKSMIGSLMY